MNLSLLRALIKETIEEMAFGGVMPGIDLKRKQIENPSDLERELGLKDLNTKNSAFKAIDKFHNTPLYKAKALSTFKNFPYDVYAVPVATVRTNIWGVDTMKNRIKILSPEEGLKKLDILLKENEVNIDLDDIRQKLDEGSTVIFVLVQKLLANFLPTPWMLIHALFEQDYTHFEDEKFEFETAVEDSGISNLRRFATMKSARDNNILSDADFTSEIFAQAVIDSRGCHFDATKAKKPETVEKLKALEDLVNNELDIRKKVTDLLEGKIVVINGYVPE